MGERPWQGDLPSHDSRGSEESRARQKGQLRVGSGLRRPLPLSGNIGSTEETVLLLFMILRVTPDHPETLAPGKCLYTSDGVEVEQEGRQRSREIMRSWACTGEQS